MDLNYSVEDEKFRLEARQWISENLPDHFKRIADSGTMSSRKARQGWYEALAKKGWLCASWPKEHGGPGWSMGQQVIFQEEASAQGAPGTDMGVYMLGPLLIEYGTDEQKREHLPKIAAGKEIWCQGYSEPNAGSDLANLALKAEHDGDHYVLNGQKIWTSGANEADWIFILVRTSSVDSKRQEGISFVLAPMSTPGIRIAPIKQITDESHFFETFFENVRVPIKNRVGPEGGGWTIAKRLLAHERVHLGSAQMFRKTLGNLTKLAKERRINGGYAIAEPEVRQRLAQLHMELDSLSAVDYRRLTSLVRGDMPGPESSIIKLYGSELFQRMCDLAMEIQGPSAQLWDDPSMAEIEGKWPKTAAQSRAYSIFSGTSEIQRNIISERVLGMPR